MVNIWYTIGMAATWVTDDAYAIYCKWLETVEVSAELNEDTTRLRLIDAILFDVLRWDRNFVRTEEHVERQGYADYLFNVKGGRVLVLEAKKVGSAFVLPNRSYPARPVPFAMIADKCPEAHKAMQQAVTYSNSVGARYTAISNGRQWLIMLTSVDNALLRDRNVIVFETLEAIRDHFSLFWDCFSPLMVQLNKPHGLLLDVRRQPAPAKLSKAIDRYPVTREGTDVRNVHATTLQYIWDEVNNSEGTAAFFKECYVAPVGHDKNRGLATQLLSDRAAADAASFEKIAAVDVPAMLKVSDRAERPVILLGRIGHGKTTFITYLKTIAAVDTLAHYVQIDVNFLDLPRTKEQVADYVYSTVELQLQERYAVDVNDDAIVRAALQGPLQGFRKTPRAKLHLDENNRNAFAEAELLFIEEQTRKRHVYLGRVVQHLRKGRKRSIAIYFDNLDKRGDLQEEAFLVASAIARDWESIVFICLRPGTFQRSRDLGVLDSVAPRLIHVNSPPVSLFLKRRLDYATAIAEGSIEPPRGGESLSKAIAQDGRAATDLFRSISTSVQKDKSLTGLFDAVSNGNLRDMLDLVGSVITSWHLNTTEMLEAIRTTGAFFLTHHQAMRAMLFGNSIYFDPRKSRIVNLLDIEHADPLEHFLRPITLFHLTDLTHESAAQGFVSYEEISARVGTYSFTPDLIETSLQFLFAKRLLEDDDFSETWPGTDTNLRPTALGRYHIAELLGRFQYLDAIVIDTPVVDPSVAGKIKIVENIGERLTRGREFLRYLNNCAQHVANTPFHTHWDRIHTKAASEMTNIEENIARN